MTYSMSIVYFIDKDQDLHPGFDSNTIPISVGMFSLFIVVHRVIVVTSLHLSHTSNAH
jgi:hypothetical protein